MERGCKNLNLYTKKSNKFKKKNNLIKKTFVYNKMKSLILIL